jgi:flagellar hook protein FlgE
MSLYGALFSGVSALNAQSQAIGITADNISNINTVGYKGTQARFSTLVTDASSRTLYTEGGVRSAPYTRIERQGLLQGTASGTDLGISGDGFFVVSSKATPTSSDARFFTRAGGFNTDATGNLVNAAGLFLQGYALNNAGAIPTTTATDSVNGMTTISVAGLSSVARPTSTVDLAANLPATASTAVGVDATTTITIYDSLGTPHTLSFAWSRTGANAWSYTVTIDSNALAVAAATGTLTFNGDGTPNTITGAAPISAPATTNPAGNGDISISFLTADFASGAASTTITFNFGTFGAVGVGQADGLTQFAADYSASLINQNGLAASRLDNIRVAEDGTVTAVFKNGQTKDIYRIGLATFPAPNELQRVDGNAYQITSVSGGALLQPANTGGAGKIAPSTLESSTVDLAEEFTNLIVYQRSYSAATRVITTADDLLDELIRLKR